MYIRKKNTPGRIPDMGYLELKADMIRAGVTQKEIAAKLGCSPEMVSLVVRGLAVSHRVRKAIAEKLGMDVKRIWPSSYLYGGPRKPGRPTVE